MASPPVNVFSAMRDPAAVLAALRAVGGTVQVVEGISPQWRRVEATFSGGLFRKKRLVVTNSPDYYAGPGWPDQLRGMLGYFGRFPVGPRTEEVLRTIRTFRFALAFPDCEVPLEGDDPRRTAVLAITKKLDGVVFTPGYLLDAEGRVLLDPTGASEPGATLPRPAPEHPCFTATAAPGPARPTSATRAANLAALSEAGFRVAAGLPEHTEPRALRTPAAIAARLLALDALFTWVTSPNASDARVRAYAARSELERAMTDEERQLFSSPRRDAEQQRDSIGWKLENMWPLAWALGFEPRPTVAGGMIGDEVISALGRFLPGLDASANDLVARAAPRTLAEVTALEDLFYCAHNAVRSAQLGGPTVPPGFHPVSDGGVVHERRHALSWLLAPGTAWDDVDLGT